MSTPNLAERIKTARLEADLTQQQLAELIGVSIFALRAWEQGTRERPRPGALTKIADETGKPLSWFVEAVVA